MGKYEELGNEIGKLVDSKQISYGDSFGKANGILAILYPNGILVEQYTDVLCLIRIIDKMFRIANNKDAFCESPYMDLAGYSLLGALKDYKTPEMT